MTSTVRDKSVANALFSSILQVRGKGLGGCREGSPGKDILNLKTKHTFDEILYNLLLLFFSTISFTVSQDLLFFANLLLQETSKSSLFLKAFFLAKAVKPTLILVPSSVAWKFHQQRPRSSPGPARFHSSQV